MLFLSEDRAGEGIFHQRSVLENLLAGGLAAHSALACWIGRGSSAGLRLAERVAVDRRRLAAAAGKLSGGNQQKLLFGRAIERPHPGVLLMNEPTRGIDVRPRRHLSHHARVVPLGYALVMTSSELEEVVGIADIVVTMYRGRVVARYERDAIAMARILADITHPTQAAA